MMPTRCPFLTTMPPAWGVVSSVMTNRSRLSDAFGLGSSADGWKNIRHKRATNEWRRFKDAKAPIAVQKAARAQRQRTTRGGKSRTPVRAFHLGGGVRLGAVLARVHGLRG